MAKCLVIIFSYSMVLFSWRMSFTCHLFFLFLPLTIFFFVVVVLGIIPTCMWYYVYLPISPFKIKFQQNLWYLFLLLLLDAFHKEEGEKLTRSYHLQTRSHPTFYFENLKLKKCKTIAMDYTYAFYLDSSVFNILPHLLSLYFFG